MKLPDVDWRRREGMSQLLAALSSEQGETRYVGGAVRDTLLGIEVSDVDLATRLQPDEVLQRLRKAHLRAVPTGLAHGTITAVLRDGPVEVTTLRRDVSTDGRRATIAYTDDWKEDAARRDFTINALFADPATGEIYDYFGGLDDLEARRVRFIGDALTRIAEDHLRILRFFRFHARFGSGEPDLEALDACTRRSNDLMALSRERIADEMLKLLALADPADTVSLMVGRGILAPVLPEIDQPGTVRLRDLIVRERASREPPVALRRLAALLPPDAELAASVAARLRLSNKAAKRLVSAAERQASETIEPRVLAYRIGTEEAIDRLLLGNGEPDHVGAQVSGLRAWERPRFPLGGGDLISMGLTAGPVIARTLRAVEADWIARDFPADEQSVRELARVRVDQALLDSQ